MARPERTQKQISERYRDNLTYYRNLSPWRKARLILGALALIGGAAAIFIYARRGPEKFFNAGPISRQHAAIEHKCEACHERFASGETFNDVLKARFHKGIAYDVIDKKCQVCHVQHSFHEANVTDERSCSSCHQEHRGPGPLKVVASSQCASCHNDAGIMQASAEKGMQMPAKAFQRHLLQPQQVVFELPRPPQGLTSKFENFWTDHPEFQLHRVGARDPDKIRFNHQRHFAADIPPVGGQKLDCNFCHKPQPDGRFMQRFNYANNCQPCHALQFDRNNPDILLPHGNVNLVRTYLRSLPAQYDDYARLKRGMANKADRDRFVGQQLQQLRNQFHSWEELDRAVFTTVNPFKATDAAGVGRGTFPGCAYCHEVKPGPVPEVTRPQIMDRWITRSDFNHAKHMTGVKCDDCHHARQSSQTSDVLMPVKADCVSCHSPQGKVFFDCMACHKYHAAPDAQGVAHAGPAVPESIRQAIAARP